LTDGKKRPDGEQKGESAMRRHLVFCLGLILVSGARAAEIKLLGGASLSSYSICPKEVGDWYSASLRYQTAYRSGFLVGAGLEWPLVRKVSLEIDILYFQKGSQVTGSGYSDSRLDYEYTLNVVSLPVLVKIKPLPHSSPYLVHGGELFYVLAHKCAYTYHPYPLQNGYAPTTSIEDIKKGTRSFGLGAVVGAGWEIEHRGAAFFVELRYHFGLLNILAEEGSGSLGIASMKPNSQAILCGLRF
jgi:hypothetical protein